MQSSEGSVSLGPSFSPWGRGGEQSEGALGDRGTTTSAEATTTELFETTTSAATAAPTTTTAPTEAPLALRADGLGVVEFGAGPESAIPALRAVLGPPDKDSGWNRPAQLQSPFGVCGEEHWRVLRWGQLGVQFTDADTGYGDGRHLSQYGYGFWNAAAGEPRLGTPEGLTLGHDYADARQRYGERATFHAGDEIVPGRIVITGGAAHPIVGVLEGHSQDSPIVQIVGGSGCGE